MQRARACRLLLLRGPSRALLDEPCAAGNRCASEGRVSRKTKPEEAAAVAAWIAERGVKRCPPAAVATTSTTRLGGSAELRAHGDGQARRDQTERQRTTQFFGAGGRARRKG
jgi:hypothetical protein